MNLKLYRHATFLMTIDGKKILVDPMFMKKGSLPPIPSTLRLRKNPLDRFPEKYPVVSDKDILLITHHHFDHFDKTASRILSKSVSVVSPANGWRRLRKMGFFRIHAMRLGRDCIVQGFKIIAVPVKHAQRWERMLYKPGLGYLVKSSRGMIYISGDTVLYQGLSEWLCKFPVDLAVFFGGAARVPLLGRHTLSGQEIISLIQDIQPRTAVILHLDSLNHCTEGRTEVRAQIRSSPLSSRVILPLAGEEYVFGFL
jgi:L-ascorbate metabolism protein UlaG (beta-lactamase superfamily)